MSRPTASIDAASAIAIDACWQQWLGLFGRRPASNGRQRAVVDPEALVLASLSLRSRERRLDDMLLAMADESRLLSVQRIKTLARMFPETVRAELAWFAIEARKGGDARWTSLAASATPGSRGRPEKSIPELRLHTRTAFMLRMRLGLGVGIKADLVGCLGGLASVDNRHVAGCSVADLQQILGYSKAATRTALDDMVRANVVLRIDGRPALYRLAKLFFQDMEQVDHGKVVALVPPPWGYSAQLFAVLIACDEIARDPRLSTAPAVVLASALRDLHDRFSHCWMWFGAEPVDARRHPGAQFADAFGCLLATLFDWARQRL